jgi:hypothetical protein
MNAVLRDVESLGRDLPPRRVSYDVQNRVAHLLPEIWPEIAPDPRARLQEELATGAAQVQIDRWKADAFFRAYPAWARSASRKRFVVTLVAEALWLLAVTAIVLSWRWDAAIMCIPLALSPMIVRRDETGGSMTRGLAMLIGISALLLGVAEWMRPEPEVSAMVGFGAAWSLYFACASLRFSVAAAAARRLAHESPDALAALLREDVIQVRYTDLRQRLRVIR